MASQPYPDENTWWPWYEGEVAARYAEAGQPFPDPAAFRWFSRCAWDIGAGMPKEQSASVHLRELEQALGLHPPDPQPEPGDRISRPVQGYVRTDGKQWADDAGLRHFRICSWFPALRCFRDHRDAALRQLDQIAQDRQGVRIFWHLGTEYWVSAGKSVDPRWSDFESLFGSFLEECAARNVRVSLTCGDMQVLCPDGREDDWHRRIAELAARVDQTTVSWFAVWNEGWQNCANPDPAYAAHLCGIHQQAFPWGAHGLSDKSEEPADLDSWSRAPANFTLKHGTRVFPDSIRRAFNCKYEGKWLLNEDEPVGAGPDVYQRDDDPRHLFGLYSMLAITGQMVTFFGGHGIKAWTPDAGLELDWGFRELPTLWRDMAIPEATQTWTPTPGHRSNAFFYPTTFADRGQGPARFDNMQSSGDAHAWAVASGGTGGWELRCRHDAEVRVWAHTGLVWEGRVSAGQPFYGGPADQLRALVCEGHR